MPRYELAGKFWEITLKGSVITTRSGKSGASTFRSDGKTIHSSDPGQPSDRTFRDPQTAKEAFKKQLRTKLAAGYRRLDGLEEASDPTPTLRDVGLEAQIIDATDDASYLVYADWLQQRGDPRGELITMQHAMHAQNDTTSFAAFKKREQVLRHAHQQAWLGEVAIDCEYRLKLDWRLGFVDTARIDVGTHPDEPDLTTIVDGLRRSAAGCAIRTLVLRGFPADFLDALECLPFPGMRRLQLLTQGPVAHLEEVVETERARIAASGVSVVLGGYEPARR